MKHQISSGPMRAIAAVTVLALSAMTVVAQDSTTSQTAPASASQSAPQLSSGVPDVLKLSRAKINEDTIISYIQTSGKGYGGMNASEIVYLHEQGVSDRVVTTMLNQRKQWTEAAAQKTAQPATIAPATTQAAYSDANTVQYPQTYAQPAVTYARPASSSMVYVIPYSPTYVSSSYYPSYRYYGYSYPSVSFSFGYFGGYHSGYYGRASYRGGGGGYHGGGGYRGGGGGSYHGGGRGGHR